VGAREGDVLSETREQLTAARERMLDWLGNIKPGEHASAEGLRDGITDWIMEEAIILEELRKLNASTDGASNEVNAPVVHG
jgi:hypothetical protein